MIFRAVIAFAAAGFCTCSCSVDDLMEIQQAPVEEEGLSLNFTSDPMDALKVTTRASDAKDDEEKQINRLYIFFFGSDGEYLKGGYLTGYDDAPDEGGFYAPGEGVTMLKIANDNFSDPSLAEGATVYALANFSNDIIDEDGNAGEMFADNNNDGLPDMFSDMASLESFVYRPREGISLGIPDGGMPMVGKKVMNLAGSNVTPEEDRVIEMKALMSRVDVNISLSSDEFQGDYPRMTLVEWSARNLPDRVPLVSPERPSDNPSPSDITTTLQRTISNNSGSISLSFYMFENIQASVETKDIDWENYYEGFDSDVIDPATGYPYGVYDPDEGIDIRQRYKPLRAADTSRCSAVELHAYYSTYNDDGSGSSTCDVRYTIWLGANHTDDFRVVRNHQYKNDITIKGITRVGNNPAHITFDARVDVAESGGEYFISILRERNHDAHFCVTPMDVYLFSENSPTMEVILGTMPDGSEDPESAQEVPDWIRMERIPAENMEAGTLPDGMDETTNDATGPWTAGNGKRLYFTTTLLDELETHETIENSRDRIYFYIDENLEPEDRQATVTLIYKENGTEVRRQTLQLVQVHLLPVTYVENGDGGDGQEHTIYMEQIEEYLDYYDPLDEHRTDQIYDGLPWAVAGTMLATSDIETLYYQTGSFFGAPICSPYNDSYNNYYDGWEYTSYVVTQRDASQARMSLNDVPVSAFQYCHNKNKRNAEGIVPANYEYSRVYGYYVPEPVEDNNLSKWFLPGITQMEKALEKFRPRYPEFEEFYWSSSAAKEGLVEREDGNRARATRIGSDGSHVSSDQNQSSMYPNGGNAPRTQELRIRAFRVDLEPYDY